MPNLYEYIDLAGLQAFKEESEAKSDNSYASKITISQNATTGVVTFKLYSADNTLLDEKTLDLDTEHIIKSVTLNYQQKKLIFTMADNTTIECDISALIDGLSNSINQVASDLSTLTTNLNSSNIDLISNNDLDTLFPDLESESE